MKTEGCPTYETFHSPAATTPQTMYCVQFLYDNKSIITRITRRTEIQKIYMCIYIYIYISPMAQQPLVGQSLLMIEASLSCISHICKFNEI